MEVPARRRVGHQHCERLLGGAEETR